MAIKDFIEMILPTANEVYKKTGVLPSLTISQAILETGGNSSNILAKGYNFFGEKGTGDKGSIRVKTKEDYGDGLVPVYDNFKIYSSPEKGATGRINLLNKERYKGVLQAKTFESQAKAIKAAGYATDRNYVSKLQGIYNSYNLGQYDVGNSFNVKDGSTLISKDDSTLTTIQNEINPNNITNISAKDTVTKFVIGGIKYYIVYGVLFIIMIIALFVLVIGKENTEKIASVATKGVI